MDDNKPIDLEERRQNKRLQEFHTGFREDMKTRMQKMRELIHAHIEKGNFPLEIGTRFHTTLSRSKGQPPHKITGYYVDTKDPENRYGYHTQQGDEGNSDYSSGMHMIRDPELEKFNGPEKWEQLQNDRQVLGGLSRVKKEGGRVRRATGGRIPEMDRMFKQAKKYVDSHTKGILNTPDDVIVKALNIAKRKI